MSEPEEPESEKKSNPLPWILLCVAGGLVFIGGMAFMMYRMFNSMSMDPVTVEARARELLPLQFPEGYHGKSAMSVMGMGMITLESDPKIEWGGRIALSTIMSAPGNQEQMRTQMRESMAKMGGHGEQVTETRPAQSFTFRGQTVLADVGYLAHPAAYEAPGRMRYTFLLVAPSKTYVLLMVQGDDKIWTHDRVQKLLDTVR